MTLADFAPASAIALEYRRVTEQILTPSWRVTHEQQSALPVD